MNLNIHYHKKRVQTVCIIIIVFYVIVALIFPAPKKVINVTLRCVLACLLYILICVVKPAEGVDNTIFDPTGIDRTAGTFTYTPRSVQFPIVDDVTMLTVLSELTDIAGLNWSVFPMLLGVSSGVLSLNKQNNIGNAANEQQEIVKAWIGNGEPSWAMLVSALKHQLIKKSAYANKIAMKYPAASES